MFIRKVLVTESSGCMPIGGWQASQSLGNDSWEVEKPSFTLERQTDTERQRHDAPPFCRRRQGDAALSERADWSRCPLTGCLDFSTALQCRRSLGTAQIVTPPFYPLHRAIWLLGSGLMHDCTLAAFRVLATKVSTDTPAAASHTEFDTQWYLPEGFPSS